MASLTDSIIFTASDVEIATDGLFSVLKLAIFVILVTISQENLDFKNGGGKL